MCQDHEHQHAPGPPAPAGQPPFPWHLGAVDAHCHPTDTMGRVPSIATMRARALTVMATRSQDQHLVSRVAAEYPAPTPGGASSLSQEDQPCVVIPSFGWHPWFSHQLYDDTAPQPTYAPESASESDSASAKRAHYAAVLTPAPDDAFVASLPVPTPLSSVIASTRDLLAAHPLALVGEAGLDKAFRLPCAWEEDDSSSAPDTKATSADASPTPGGRQGRRLSPYRVRPGHQQAVLAAQLRLAGDVGRPVSLHGVQVHGVLHDTVSACWKGHEKEVISRREKRRIAPGAEDFDAMSDSEEDGPGERQKAGPQVGSKPYPPRICLHSFSGSIEVLKQWLHPAIPADVFFSFSTAVNLGTEAGRARLGDVLRAVPDGQILVESDLHIAGGDMDAALEDMYRFVCEAKGWSLEEGVVTIRGNYERFIFG